MEQQLEKLQISDMTADKLQIPEITADKLKDIVNSYYNHIDRCSDRWSVGRITLDKIISMINNFNYQNCKPEKECIETLFKAIELFHTIGKYKADDLSVDGKDIPSDEYKDNKIELIRGKEIILLEKYFKQGKNIITADMKKEDNKKLKLVIRDQYSILVAIRNPLSEKWYILGGD